MENSKLNECSNETLRQILESLKIFDTKLMKLEDTVETNGENLDIVHHNQKTLKEELEATLKELHSAKEELKKTKAELKDTKDMLFEMSELVSNDTLKRDYEARNVIIWNLDEKVLEDTTRKRNNVLKSLAMETIRKYLPEVYEPGVTVKRLPNACSGRNRLRLMVTFATIHEKQMFLARCSKARLKTVLGGKTLLQRHVANRTKGLAKILNGLENENENSDFSALSNGLLLVKSKRTFKSKENDYENCYDSPKKPTLNDHSSQNATQTCIIEKPLSYLRNSLLHTVQLYNQVFTAKQVEHSSNNGILLQWYWSITKDTLTKVDTKERQNMTE